MPAYDFIPSWHDTGACMDKRHIAWLYELLVRMRPERTLEIGGYTGCSSAAFVAAGVPDVHFAEISPNEKFLSIVRGNGTLHQRKGCDVIREQAAFELILLDGAHDLESVREEWDAMQDRLPRVLVLHDTWSKDAGFPHCEGPSWLMDQMIGPEWHSFSDMRYREGEMTHRGLTMLTREDMLRDVILAAKVVSDCL
mgnify:CR=1 FL=1